MTTTRQAGPGMVLPSVFPTYNTGANVPAGIPQYAQQAVGPLALPPGASELIPAGQFLVQPGPYSFLQAKDPITGTWRTLGTSTHGARTVLSDGQNFRLANLSGCAVGAFITNVGSGYTSAPSVSASVGDSEWTAIVGGAINSTVTITAGGSGYTYPPILLIDPPPAGGVQATATCTISAGAINAVTVVDQGAGYTTAPRITVLRDPRDTTGSGAVLTVNSTLAGAGAVTAILCTNHGTPVTAVPTLTISGGGGSSAAATAVMCFTVTGYTVGTAGAAYGNAQPILTQAVGGIVGGSAGSVVNPSIGPGMFTPRMGIITSTSTSGGALTTGGVIQDGGLFQAVPVSITSPGNGVPTTQAVASLTVGGVTDTSYIYSI